MFCSLVFHIQFEFAYLGCILWFGWVWGGFLCAYFWGLCVVGCASNGWVAFDGCSVMICLALLVCGFGAVLGASGWVCGCFSFVCDLFV